ncbi:MAG TPA: N-acetyl-gamma-glutamyl-phosphate reductase [Parafilimonas sp.]|nr:N-acetyl-gamma-glutamyl-phosphate reductase [Parafilimonas sp.]
MKIQVGIVGGAGYTGGELIRLLINHPHADIAFVHSKSNAGKYVYDAHKDLIGETELQFTGALDLEKLFSTSFHEGAGAALFLCSGHGESRKFLQQTQIPGDVKIIDLSNDFRLAHSSQLAARSFVYGLPELNTQQIRSAKNIANPGCFATAIQLGLLPLAKAGLLGDVYTTGITGSTGAGQSLTETSHFSWRSNNIQSYKTLSHQHVHEIHQSLHQLQSSFPLSINGTGPKLSFVPWRGDFTRGIYVSSTVNCDLSADEAKELYTEFYSDHPFTVVSDVMIDMKQAVNTNKCLLHVEKHGNKLVIHSTLDNLLKGASGQAVQNMNLMFGIEETAGLKLKANYF